MRNANTVASQYPEELLNRISKVKNKRARLVLDTIVANGNVTTDELKELGYNHAPRAARDVRELGFTLITTMITGAGGKRMAAYSLGTVVQAGKSGRIQIPKKERDAIIAAAGSKCQICGAIHDLQVDHRVPYEVAGESLKNEPNACMVLDGTCNRRKSWTCEHCQNFLKLKQVSICQSCYWANPEQHSHVAMEQMRRVDVVFLGRDAKAFDEFRERLNKDDTAQNAIKEIVLKLGE
jgi:hypothetical protein